MKENNTLKITVPEMSIEEFDSIDKNFGKHKFSDEYLSKKEAALREYKQQKTGIRSHSFLKYAAAAAALLIATPVAVNAATDGEFFQRIWGNAGNETIESYEYTQIEEGKVDINGNTATQTFTMPEVEYTQIDETRASEIIGDNIANNPTSIQMGDTKMEILSVVRDNNSIIAEYTLEKEGGVDCFNYSDFDNQAKGAWINEDGNLNFGFLEGGGKIYVDLEKSTPDKLYCYEYMVGNGPMSGYQITDHITLWYQEYTKSMTEIYSDPDADISQFVKSENEIIIPLADSVESTVLKNAAGGTIELSPISMNLDASKGLFDEDLGEGECIDMDLKVEINYKDGTSYLVMDENVASYHYICGMGNNVITLFNRLVDIEQVDSITVNGVVYTF